MLAKRLKELRTEKGYTQVELSNILNINRGTYAYYEQGKRQPDYVTLMKFADFYNVGLDYLMGRSNDRHFKADALSFHVDEALTPEEYDDIEAYIKFKLSQRKKKSEK